MELDEKGTIQVARNTWGGSLSSFRFLTEDEASQYNDQKRELLQAISAGVNRSFKGSKPHLGKLSQGCSHCGNGYWTCVFVNRLCNADCFFCPGIQTVRELDSFADGLYFEDFADFLDYIEAFDTRGVSFSGGEPFLDFDGLVDKVARTRAVGGNALYTWAYTNGTKATSKRLERLSEAGLNEIRFNIAATDYQLDKVELAKGIIETVTVEIPAVPEDFDRLKSALREMAKIGVDHINLHQMMAFGRNIKDLQERDYRFMYSQAPTVVESELMALELMKLALEENLEVAINYCSQIFKSRWQVRGYNKRLNRNVMKKTDGETEFGYIRRLSIDTNAAPVDTLLSTLDGLGDGLWERENDGDLVYFDQSVLGQVCELGEWQIRAQYFRPVLTPEDDPVIDSQELALNENMRVHILCFPASEVIEMGPDEANNLDFDGDSSRRWEGNVARLRPYEEIKTGLPDYF